MSVKEANEITVKVTCSNDELIKHLINKGLLKVENLHLWLLSNSKELEIRWINNKRYFI